MDTLDIDQCAEFLKIERKFALKLAGEGALPGAKIGRAWVFLKDDLIDYLKAQVRAQMRERAAERDVDRSLEKSVQKSGVASPMAMTRADKPRRNRIDLDKYDSLSPEFLSQVGSSQV